MLDRCCADIGRDPASLRYSVMSNYLIGRDDGELRERALRMAAVVPRMKRDTADEIVKSARGTMFVGTPAEIVEQVRDYAELGVELFMLQHFLLDDRDALELLAKEVMPAIA